mmetsp:Transcript_34701/g.58927  ORF Transcript_34701/g.58927 Transcript_34701/m.58927 type:complete len:200 (-) Transcript_34701:723-1322(-)
MTQLTSQIHLLLVKAVCQLAQMVSAEIDASENFIRALDEDMGLIIVSFSLERILIQINLNYRLRTLMLAGCIIFLQTRRGAHHIHSSSSESPTHQYLRRLGVPDVCLHYSGIGLCMFLWCQHSEPFYPNQRSAHISLSILRPYQRVRRDISGRILLSQLPDHANSMPPHVYLLRIAPSNYSLPPHLQIHRLTFLYNGLY